MIPLFQKASSISSPWFWMLLLLSSYIPFGLNNVAREHWVKSEVLNRSLCNSFSLGHEYLVHECLDISLFNPLWNFTSACYSNSIAFASDAYFTKRILELYVGFSKMRWRDQYTAWYNCCSILTVQEIFVMTSIMSLFVSLCLISPMEL